MISVFPAGVPSLGSAVAEQLFSGQGQCYFVDNTPHGLGNDGNDGKSPSSPVLTIAKGYSLLTSGNNDTLFVIGTGTAYTLTAALVWSKNYAHCIGITAPLMVSQRARITSGTASLSPMMTVSGTGCVFRNLQFANFGATTPACDICMTVSGQRNYFGNCQFAGGGNATVRAATTMRSIVIGGGGNGENLFEQCMFGLDTVDTAAANYEMELTGSTPRNMFRDCLWSKRTVTGGAGGGFLVVDASGVDRWNIFYRPIFYNFTIAGGVALTTALLISGTDGDIIIQGPVTGGGYTGLSGGAKTNLLTDNAVAASTYGVGLEPSS